MRTHLGRLSLFVILFLAWFLLSACPARADVAQQLAELTRELGALKSAVYELQGTVDAQNQKIAVLETENQRLKKELTETSATVKAAPVVIPTQVAKNTALFTPEIGVIGDIVGFLSESEEDSEGNDKLSVRELELIFGADVDPYSRFDATIAFSDFEDVSVEEAYLTMFALPGEVTGRLGRIRPRVGKTSPQHRDSLETVDEPLVIQEYLGVEGLSRTGVEFSRYLPLPWESVAHEVTLGVIEGGAGEEGTMLGETRRRPTYYGRLRNFWEISDLNNFELGGTYLLGSSDEDSAYEVNAFGVDFTYNHFFNPLNKLKLQTEALFQDRDEAFIGDDEEDVAPLEDPLFRQHPWGIYALADYRLAERFGVGARWDFVEPVNFESNDSRSADIAWNGMVTFFQSEFARWRFQYQHVDFAEGDNDNRFFLQGTFAIGTHKHKMN